LFQVGTPVQRNEPPGVGRVQVHHTHRVRPVAMNLGMDPPFQRDQSARMLDDRAIDVIGKDLFRPHGGLFGAGARTDEAFVGSRHADRDVPEHPDRALQVQHARQRRGLLAQQFFFAHEK
jgi:hypothetical protein